MEADSSMGFHQGIIPSFYNHHMVSFQSGAVNDNYNNNNNNTGFNNSRGVNSPVSSTSTSSNAGLFVSPNSSIVRTIPVLTQSGSSSSSDSIIGSMPKFKYVTGSPADWSLNELTILKEGLSRYAHEPTVMKYVKIAALLPTKTIRDVALRCWWNTSKESSRRRKPDDHYTGKKMREMKIQERMVGPTSVADTSMVSSNNNSNNYNIAPFSLLMHNTNRNVPFHNEGPVIDSATQQLMEENNQLLTQIAANIEMLKLQDNPELFLHTSNNIKSILHRMSETPGIMCRMPPLPISLDDHHLNSIFQLNPMVCYGGQHSNLKQEPRC